MRCQPRCYCYTLLASARYESHLDLSSISNLISAFFHLRLGATGVVVISNIATVVSKARHAFPTCRLLLGGGGGGGGNRLASSFSTANKLWSFHRYWLVNNMQFAPRFYTTSKNSVYG